MYIFDSMHQLTKNQIHFNHITKKIIVQNTFNSSTIIKDGIYQLKLQSNQSMSEQRTLRKELHELAAKVTIKGHNINAFKRRKSQQSNNSSHKFLQNTLPTETSKESSKNNQYTIIKHHSADRSAILPPDRYTKRTVNARKKSHITDYNQTNYTQNFITRRNTNPIEIVSKHQEQTCQPHPTIIKKDKYTFIQARNDEGTSFVENEKAIFKNRTLNDSHFENWINQAIIQRCPEQKFDKSIVNPAIKRFQVDRNSLLSQGISQTNISRLLKSLFVYSIGFNNLITQICNNNSQVKKNIWRVFSLLVEYCSQGIIQTVITDLKRQNEIQQQQLKKQIEKQQQVIERNHHLNQEKNQKIYKENNQLRTKNQQLELDRVMLKQANQEHQRAFTEEISLRLMFQSKISDLHRLYRELEIKHHKLFSDFQLKINEIAFLKEKANHFQNQNLILKKEKAVLEGELFEKIHEVRQLNENINKMKKQQNDSCFVETQRKIEKKINQNIIKQKESKETQLINQLTTTEMSLGAHRKAHESLREEYYRSLEENNRLITKLNNELADITHRLYEQKIENQTNAYFLSEINCLSLKVQEKLTALSRMEEHVKSYIDKIEELQLQNETSHAYTQSLEENLKAHGDTIINLKRVNTELEESMHQALKINEILQKKAKELVRQAQKHKDLAHECRDKYEASLSELQKSQIKIAMLNQQISKLQGRISNNTYQTETNQKVQQQKYTKIETQFNNRLIQMQKTREAFDIMQQKYKNQKFERDSLEYKYRHSLTVIESLQQVVKTQNSSISEMQRNLEETSLSLRLANNKFTRLENKSTATGQQNQRKIVQLQQILRDKHAFLHPMILEDLFEHYRRLQDQTDHLKRTFNTWKTEHQLKKFQMEERLACMEIQFQKKESQLTEQLVRKGLEVEYEYAKRKEYIQRIEYLQLTLKAREAFEIKESPVPSESYRQKQKRYLNIISENHFKINALVADLETIENHNQQLIERIQSTEQELQKRFQTIVTIQREKQQLKEVNHQLADEHSKFQAVRKQLVQQINERESLISSYVPEYKSLRQSASQKMKKHREQSPIGQRKPENVTVLKRKVSLMEPVIVQIKEREEQRNEGRRPSDKSSYENEDWRADFSSKLRSSFGYYK